MIHWLYFNSIVKYPCMLEDRVVYSRHEMNELISEYNNPRISLYSFNEFKNNRPLLDSAVIDKIAIRVKCITPRNKYLQFKHIIITNKKEYEIILPFRREMIFLKQEMPSHLSVIWDRMLTASYHVPRLEKEENLRTEFRCVNKDGKELTYDELLEYYDDQFDYYIIDAILNNKDINNRKDNVIYRSGSNE